MQEYWTATEEGVADIVVESSIKFTVNVMEYVRMLDRQPYVCILADSELFFCIIVVLRALCCD